MHLKNRSGGLAQLGLSHKVVHRLAHPELGERCHVFLLDKYFSKLPESAKEKDTFYLRPVTKVPTNEAAPRYSCVPVGKNQLSRMVKDMCSEANIGKKTNHSLRASGITSLFQAGVSEKVIQDRSGHRSLDGLRKYERVSEEQQAMACHSILPTSTSSSSTEASLNMTNPDAPAQLGGSNVSVLNSFSSVYQQLQKQPCCSFSGANLKLYNKHLPSSFPEHNQVDSLLELCNCGVFCINCQLL